MSRSLAFAKWRQNGVEVGRVGSPLVLEHSVQADPSLRPSHDLSAAHRDLVACVVAWGLGAQDLIDADGP